MFAKRSSSLDSVMYFNKPKEPDLMSSFLQPRSVAATKLIDVRAQSGQTIGRLNKTCKNAIPRTILVSLGRDRRFGDNFAKELQFIPLSNDTVARRNEDIAEGVEQQPFGKLRDKLFSIQLDEATDSN
ncbi:hypothetical protein TNCV_2061721 [Trichonephila clavipes]|nr:hypothetical protein TNCV_2061721 [Trichonephila clavipes]